MAPTFLVDAERDLRDITIRDKYRFWLVFRLKDYTYKRWFSSRFERDNYQQFNIPGAELIDSGELPKQLSGRL